MNSTLNYTTATQLLEQGKAKDAYAAFLSVVELSTQQLYGVKFVHQTIVSKPQEYDESIALLRSSLDQLEKIAIHKLPGAIVATPQQQHPKAKSPPPPVPPKPTRIYQKPTIPPKPKEIVPKIEAIKSPPAIAPLQKRGRGNSVSFAEDSKLLQMTIIENDDEDDKMAETGFNLPAEDEDDDDEEVVVFETAATKTVSPLAPHPHPPAPPPPPKRPATSTFTSANSLKPHLRKRSQSWVVQSDDSSQRDSIDVLLETVVDPRNLVPAQTNTGDSISLPTLTATTPQPNYVPNIPAPPLLATHRRLQQRLNELEADLESTSTETDGLLLRSERSHKVHCAKQTLEKVRTLYMSAMTIPSILQFPPQLIAYQLTLIESSIFRGIPPEALLSHSARTPHKKIVASTDFFNFITRSIEHSILLPQEASRRAEIIHRWIKIATKLLALNNYQTLKAVISALGTPPIQRLRRTWECIPKKRMGRLELLNTLMSESDNYRKYREHMGLERKRLWSKPVVPFLGVFIHDVTYLYAAAKGNQQDGRVQDVLGCIQLFQRAPEYPQQPPPSFVQAQKKHLFRPMLSDALHFGSSSKKNSNRTTTAALMGEDQRQETEVELEQQLIIQYLLMRPWVSEKVIDALSNLREPPKPRSISSPTSSRYNSDSNVSLSITTTMTNSSTATTPMTTSPSTATNNNSSILGNASSFMRFNSSTHQQQQPSEDATDEDSKKSIVGGFWPFRKSTDMSRSSVNTEDPPSWHDDFDDDEDEDDEDDDDEEEEDEQVLQQQQQQQQQAVKHGMLSMRKRPSTMVNPSNRGHNRSISLPSKSILVSDIYRSS
ncbi:ras guanine nucleotide exchange factor domain-containing protein [Mucor lusitanicus]|uniref:Ras guanine nucleotide exchange factor domain-containing protein n=1 Tax=Mucor circinelloides f. lusitanicus TaxID=29924 RepID=A0A8H4BC54_MUCCL|nr:ras guanine nucleotide exchange factor domain-containing protein [Mucor lusitanicus]